MLLTDRWLLEKLEIAKIYLVWGKHYVSFDTVSQARERLIGLLDEHRSEDKRS